MGVRDRLAELGLDLPEAPAAVASYVPVVVSGGLAFVAGQVPMVDGQVLHPGRVGEDVTVEEAAEAARWCAVQALAALDQALGDVDRVRRVVQVGVFVASAPGFTDQPSVANGASDLLVQVFGDAGRHARFTVGVSELPLGASVEVAVTVEVV